MIGYFKERSSFQVPALMFLALLLKFGYLSYQIPEKGYYDAGGMLTTWLNSLFAPGSKNNLVNIICLLVLIASAIFANLVTVNRRMFNQRHLLVALSILLFTSLFPGTNVLQPALFILPLLIGVFAYITRLYQSEHPRTTIINAGILSGIAYLLYHPFLFVLPACFIGLAFMRPFRLAEWLLLLLGMVTPAYFLLAIEFLSNHWHPYSHLPKFIFSSTGFKLSAYWWVAVSTALVWLFAGFVAWQVQTRRMVIQGRKNWYALLFLGLFMIPGIFVPSGNAFGMLTLLSFPVGSLSANAFSGETKNVGQMLFFWLIIIMVAIVGWGWRSGAL